LLAGFSIPPTVVTKHDGERKLVPTDIVLSEHTNKGFILWKLRVVPFGHGNYPTSDVFDAILNSTRLAPNERWLYRSIWTMTFWVIATFDLDYQGIGLRRFKEARSSN
jgi:hypothetical protein